MADADRMRGVSGALRSPGALLAWPPPRPSTRGLVITAGAAVLLALLVLGGWAWYAAEQRRVQGAYAAVMVQVQAAEAPDAPAEAKARATRELEQLLARYPAARTVPQAAYELGNLRFALKQYAPARTAYDLAVQRGATGLVRALARSGVGRAWEAERDFARAADAYGSLVKELEPRSFLYEDALIDQARALELAGRKADAVALYERVLKDVPMARRADEVRMRLATLGTAAR
jgi:tetratricopeptide (TPR) repeat protein